MTVRTVAQKMGIKPGWRAYFVNPPAGVMGKMDLPDVVVNNTLAGEFDYVHLFVVTQRQMRSTFPELVHHVAPDGKLWVSWPKSRKLGSDLSLPKVIEIGYDFGLVESTCLRVDDTWSGLRFTHPKEGKTYQNSHGTLPEQRMP